MSNPIDHSARVAAAMTGTDRRRVAAWLLVCAAMVFAMVFASAPACSKIARG